MTEENKIIKGYEDPFSIVYHEVWDNEEITPQERYVYLCLLRYANFYDKQCFPSINTICKKTKYGRTTVNEIIKSLAEKGFIVKKGRIKANKGQDTNLYIINRIGSTEEYHPSTTEYRGSTEEYTNNKQLNNKQINNNISSNEDITHIVEYLNLKANKKYKPTISKTIKLIRSRMNEGYTIQDFETVIDTKVNSWKDHADMCKYLRPETLFGTKFEAYLNEAPNTYKQKEKEQSNVPFELSESDRLIMEQLNNPK